MFQESLSTSSLVHIALNEEHFLMIKRAVFTLNSRDLLSTFRFYFISRWSRSKNKLEYHIEYHIEYHMSLNMICQVNQDHEKIRSIKLLGLIS